MIAVKKILDRFLYGATVTLFALLVVVVVWQVFSRQVLNSPATWTDETARVAFVWLALFASALVFGERGHIAMEFLARKMSPIGRRIVGCVVQAGILLFALTVLVWGGGRAAMNAWTLGLSVLPVSFGQMYLAVALSGVLIAFYASYHLRAVLRGEVEAYPELHADDEAGGTPARGEVSVGTRESLAASSGWNGAATRTEEN